jgi:hypothetical protein
MIRRLLSTAGSFLLYFLAATLVAEGIIAAYVWSQWELDGDKLARMAEVGRGLEPSSEAEAASMLAQAVKAEQPAYDEILDRRARAFRDLELREQALQTARTALLAEQEELTEARERLAQATAALETRLAALTQGAEAEGRDQVRRILESLRPDQAKIQLMEMLDRDEIDEVVLLLSEMQDTKRSKILGEFKTDEDNEKVAEVLRRIREGEPKATIAQETAEQLRK